MELLGRACSENGLNMKQSVKRGKKRKLCAFFFEKTVAYQYMQYVKAFSSDIAVSYVRRHNKNVADRAQKTVILDIMSTLAFDYYVDLKKLLHVHITFVIVHNEGAAKVVLGLKKEECGVVISLFVIG
jgi:hypothetical protein